MKFLAVGLGGCLGAMLRYSVSLFGQRFAASAWPVATFSVNILGAFCIGLLATLLGQKFGSTSTWYVFAVTGVLGGFTTFSSFSLETVNLIGDGKISLACLYVLGSVALCLIGVCIGRAVAQQMIG